MQTEHCKISRRSSIFLITVQKCKEEERKMSRQGDVETDKVLNVGCKSMHAFQTNMKNSEGGKDMQPGFTC